MKRIENFANEKTLENKRKELTEEIKFLKDDRQTLLKQIRSSHKLQLDYKADKEVLDNYTKYAEGFIVNNNIKTLENLKNSKKVNFLNDKQEKIFIIQTQIQKEKNIRDKKKNDLANQLQRMVEKTEEQRKELHSLDILIKEKSTKLKALSNQLLLHYHKLLFEGKDTRSEGLTWIVKAIWNLGKEVIMSYIPTYFDEECIKYLFLQAASDIELIKMEEEVEDARESLMMYLTKRKTSVKQSMIFSTEVSFGFNHQANTLENPLHDILSQQFNVANLIELLSKKPKFSEEGNRLISKIKALEENLKIRKREISKNKGDQLSRINKEFMLNDYQRRFKVNQEVLISAIVGKDHLKSEKERQIREQRVYLI